MHANAVVWRLRWQLKSGMLPSRAIRAALPALLLILASLLPVYLLFIRPMVAERS